MGCGIRSRSNAPRVRYGTDTIFSVVLYRHDGEIGTSLDPNVADVIEPSSLASITAEVRTEFGGVEDVPITIHGKMLKVEVTREMTERLSLGVYLLRLKVREEDIRFADGYRDMVLVTELCQVVSEGADAGCPQGNIAVAISKLAEGKSAYQAYLETTSDNPKKTIDEWLASLTGESAYQIYLRTTSDNPKKSETEWVASLMGATGESAYQIYLRTTSDNPKKSETEWVASLMGATGESAYQIYLRTTSDNPKKSETEWVASLTGKSAYQIYLDTTNDSPKMTEAEWATGGWLVVFELIKNVRGTR